MSVPARGLFIKVRGGKVVWYDADGNQVKTDADGNPQVGKDGKSLAPKEVVLFEDPNTKEQTQYRLSPALHEGLTAEQLAELAAQYHSLDTSHDGQLQLEEWIQWTARAGFTNDPQYGMMAMLSAAEVERAFRVWDLDKDSGISFEEYVRMMAGLQSVAHRWDEKKASLFKNAEAQAALIRTKYEKDYLNVAALLQEPAKRDALWDAHPDLYLPFWCGVLSCPCTLGLSFSLYCCQVRAKRAFEADSVAAVCAQEARSGAQEELKQLKAKFLEGPTVAELERS